MLAHIYDAFALFSTWANLAAIVCGVTIGVILGCLPGMTTPMAVGLVLPFTYTMPALTAILLLVGVYKGGTYGGSISAILINTPGVPAAACTVLDGYPLAKQGKAGKALKAALFSSCIADFISNLALICTAQFAATFALSFGPPQFVALIIFSLTIIANVSGDSLAKGVISAVFGMMAAMVGEDLLYGTHRFSFGVPSLDGGLPFLPLLIGLFVIPEILNELTKKPVSYDYDAIKRSDDALSWAEYRHCLKSVLRGSVIGAVLGAIPGIGASPSAFASYSEARRTSKHPERFGKGALEGVAASEAGANGSAGSTLIPLLSLGIPGDVVTAVILGAFMLHNLTPGPVFFQSHIQLIYALFIGIMLSSVTMLGVGLVLIRGFAKVADIPRKILFPSVLVLCVFGSYVVNNTLFGVIVMMVAGIVAFVFTRFGGLPVAPFLIAFVLEPIFEDNFRRAVLQSRGSFEFFCSSPISIFFYALTILSIASTLRGDLRSRRTLSATQNTGH